MIVLPLSSLFFFLFIISSRTRVGIRHPITIQKPHVEGAKHVYRASSPEGLSQPISLFDQGEERL
jgi:hypothetical protein